MQCGVTNCGSLTTDTALKAEILHLLYGPYVVVVLIGRVEAQNVHVKPGALLDQGEADASGTDNSDCFPGDFVAQKWKVGMPIAPTVFSRQMLGGPEFAGERAHQEEGKLRRCFRQDVGGIGEWDFVLVGIGLIDVVKSNGVLCDYFERAFSGGENLGVDLIAQGGDQAFHAGFHFFYDQPFRRSFGLGIDLKIVSLVAKKVEGIADVAGGKNADSVAHGPEQCIAGGCTALVNELDPLRTSPLRTPVSSAVEKDLHHRGHGGSQGKPHRGEP